MCSIVLSDVTCKSQIQRLNYQKCQNGDSQGLSELELQNLEATLVPYQAQM
jgi:hypothetical protein